jgi:hypothetical protein
VTLLGVLLRYVVQHLRYVICGAEEYGTVKPDDLELRAFTDLRFTGIG